MKKYAITAAAVTAAIALGGCGSSSTPAKSSASVTSTPATVTVKGDLTLTDSDLEGAGMAGCSGSGGYDDLTGGAQVTVLDAAGKTVGVSELDNGTPPLSNPTSTTECEFTFAVAGVPTTSKFYQVQVAHRQGPTYSLQQIESTVHLTIG